MRMCSENGSGRCELSSDVLMMEREILDLRELCTERDRVASAKNEAIRLLQEKIKILENKTTKEVGTETEKLSLTESRKNCRAPGYLVMRGFSPPPLDPSECDDEHLCNAQSSFVNVDDLSFTKRQKKRVTFELPAKGIIESSSDHEKELYHLITVLEEEKSVLTSCLNDKETSLREAKQVSLKNRAVYQSRLKELEEKNGQLSDEISTKIDSYTIEIDSLRNSRDWEVKQNGILKEELERNRTKISQVIMELDESEKKNRDMLSKLKTSDDMKSAVMLELIEAESLVVMMEEQKNEILDDVDRLKDALRAQDALIDTLEADVVIYEEHIGILRESLGASKVDHRAIIRSRAFETKLKALELEKEQICRRSFEDKVLSNGLRTRIMELEEENEKLVEKLCESEMMLKDQQEMELIIQKMNDRRQTELECTERLEKTDAISDENYENPKEDIECVSELLSETYEQSCVLEELGLNESSNDTCGLGPSVCTDMITLEQTQEKYLLNNSMGSNDTEMTRLVSENIILRQCVDDSARTQNDVYEDLEKLCDLKSELETAVNALKGEVWSLNKQLESSYKECARLQALNTQLEEEQIKNRQTVNDLLFENSETLQRCSEIEQEQQLLRDQVKSLEVVSSERLTHNEEMKVAYQLLTTYYEELQSAYNDLYAQENHSNQSSDNDSLWNILIETLQIDVQGNDNKTSIVRNNITSLKTDILLLNEKVVELEMINQALMERIPKNGEMDFQQSANHYETCILSLKDEILHLTDINRKQLEELEIEKTSNKTNEMLLSRQNIDSDILRAKLITKQTNLDSLLRSNSELTSSNLQLQDEIDEIKRKGNVSCEDIVECLSKVKISNGLSNGEDMIETNSEALMEATRNANNDVLMLEQSEYDCNDDVEKYEKKSSGIPNEESISALPSEKNTNVCEVVRNAHDALTNRGTLDVNDYNCGVDKLGVEIKSFIMTCSSHISSLIEENAHLLKEQESTLSQLAGLETKNSEFILQIRELEEKLRKDDIQSFVLNLKAQNDLLQKSEMALMNVVDDLTNKLQAVSRSSEKNMGVSMINRKKEKNMNTTERTGLNEKTDVGSAVKLSSHGWIEKTPFTEEEKCRKRSMTSCKK